MKKYAFTLAEVLITLTIIGVIAALTIPNLMKKYDSHVNYVALKKYNSILTNTYKLIEREDSSFEEWNTKDDGASAQLVANKFANYLKIQKICGEKVGCWSSKPSKTLTGIDWYSTSSKGIGGGFSAMKLKDGVNLCFDAWNPNVNEKYTIFGVKANTKNAPISVWVDVNGNKGPNVVGRDVFAFILTERGFLPAGVDDYSKCSKTVIGEEKKIGASCAYRVLKEGGINY